MNIAHLLAPEMIRSRAAATSKKRTLELLSELLTGDSPSDPATRAVFEALIGRERLGSTGLGRGVALPHARIAELEAPTAALVSLSEPVDFDAMDRQPVDLLFALLVPEHCTDEHLRILAALAELFSRQEFCEALRASDTPEAMYQLFVDASGDSGQR
jgi:PTS system nitrogen regulatory IIA component